MWKNKIVSDFDLMNIPIKENCEPLVSLRDFSKEIKIDIDEITKKYDKLKKEECYVRESVAIMLSQAQSLLPKNHKIKIVDGFRSLKVQKIIYKTVSNEIKERNPKLSKKMIELETNKWVANPKTIPPHTTGGAIDITILNELEEELDMGTEINSISKKSATYSIKISKKAIRNRLILIKIMNKVGFKNYPIEWWHWSYGDRMWAYYTNKRFAVYGKVKKYL